MTRLFPRARFPSKGEKLLETKRSVSNLLEKFLRIFFLKSSALKSLRRSESDRQKLLQAKRSNQNTNYFVGLIMLLLVTNPDRDSRINCRFNKNQPYRLNGVD